MSPTRIALPLLLTLVGCHQAAEMTTIRTPHSSLAETAPEPPVKGSAIIIDHRHAKANLARADVEKAIQKLVIAYGHTSHGSQLVDGLASMEKALGVPYSFSKMHFADSPFQGASDLGNPDRTSWAAATERYLRQHPETNVILWSWCGQCSTGNPGDIQQYLGLMDGLERKFPKVKFVYMTGHLDGSGSQGALYQRSQEIRTFCRDKGKVLYDFGDIERYDPDGKDYLDLGANDNCDYRGGNWAQEWTRKHPNQVFACNPAHSQPLNGNLKAYAAWALFVQLAGSM